MQDCWDWEDQSGLLLRFPLVPSGTIIGGTTGAFLMRVRRPWLTDLTEHLVACGWRFEVIGDSPYMRVSR